MTALLLLGALRLFGSEEYIYVLGADLPVALRASVCGSSAIKALYFAGSVFLKARHLMMQTAS